VIYPPVDVDAFALRQAKDDFYVVVSRLVPYKRVDVVVEAFRRMPDRELVVIGDGPQFAAIARTRPANVHLLGHATHHAVVDHLQHARAFVFAAEEDFGIAPVEALACGTPVIALGKGGSLESVAGGDDSGTLRTGVFFADATAAAVVDAVRRFEALSPAICAQACRDRAMEFSSTRFRQEFGGFAELRFRAFQAARGT
jgi:glycosyltransferase involved in cell wall biosynthesis